MNDTILQSTRCNTMKKMSLLQYYCTEYSMMVNQSRLNFCHKCRRRRFGGVGCERVGGGTLQDILRV